MYNEESLESKFTDKIFGGIFVSVSFVIVSFLLVLSVPVCVQRCPDRFINSSKQISNFINSTGVFLCDPRIPPLLYESQPRILNASLCPTLPLYPTIPIGGVCIPVNFINHSNFANFQYNADSEFTLSLYQIIICGLMGSGKFIVVVGFLFT
ncbi:unnamed protein product [Schistosoma curassoni]|uniref:FZ domain-containing protein n=1 Tax=Schistosoma curassoni TaxID=6186 RepID=A0A183JYC4_9TREM|nr:unnamed protein product [Schistosoma curassoni]